MYSQTRSFREFLGLRENDSAYVVLDEKNHQLCVSPAAEKNLVYLEILFGDEPGALAKAAAILEKEGVDLISTESHSLLRGNRLFGVLWLKSPSRSTTSKPSSTSAA